METKFEEIPSPPALPFLGNVADVDADLPLSSFIRFADQYGMLRQTWHDLSSLPLTRQARSFVLILLESQ
jgi:hypothetical protein